ncbi:MAG: flagellar biosynthesis protein FliQ [Parvibaculum sp.]|jgi:flagellar biosynthetic protein FliQ|uniref:flagellar biosynthesis protein FliQ n=1 Tax=Parvibaculum sp. TaxID=2024848 RepID=UPI0025ECB5B2|nr:flagellar biosynthesis protein FliQ [Parvibaculum sp.]MCE9650672.1 flagellar biosynthesis protein FliQ [Parvibaculum sp.]
MSGPEVVDVARQSIYVMLQIAAPMMIVALVVGIAIALLQALTQVQEMTLVFVPKIVAIFVVLLLALPFMGQAMASYMNLIAQKIVAG